MPVYNSIGWLYDLKEDQFAAELQSVLMPSRAIQTPELLKGRSEHLRDIQKSLYSPGRQIFVHGYRGVGKTSLAQTAAFQFQSPDTILLSCTNTSTFFSIIHDMLQRAMPSDPRIIKQFLQKKASLKLSILSADITQSVEKGRVTRPETLNECLRLTELLPEVHSERPVVVIDEFDLLTDLKEQSAFSDFIKQVGDQNINVRFIFCGIGDSVDDLFKSHASVYRYFHPVRLERLPWENRYEIIDNAANHLGIDVDETTKIRIARISDGFPHYIHLICEKLFWIVFEEPTSTGEVTSDMFEVSMKKASDAMQPELKRPYEQATQKYRNEYEEILWAAADNHELLRPSSEIYNSYLRIMEELGRKTLDRTMFNRRINELKRESCGKILKGSRTGWYEYREKIVRGYARLRAEQAGVRLEIEHPLQKPRLRGSFS